MALNVALLNGLSGTSAQSVIQQNPISTATRTSDDSDINIKYNKYKGENSSVPYYKFPSEIPKYKTVIVARDFGSQASITFGAKSKVVSGFVLPIPSESPLVDTYQVGYDDNFSLLAAIASAAGVGEQTQRVARYFGFNLNKQKTVLMESPLLKRHEFRWKLAPKSREESFDLKIFVDKLKLGMMPPVLNGTFGALIGFPYVYEIFFSPNSNFLYPLKPCVLESLSVNFSGAGQSTSFFYGGAPESIVLTLNFLELEFWVRQDWERWVANSNPVDTISNSWGTR